MTKAKAIVVCGVAIGAVTASVIIRRHAELRYRENEKLLQAQEQQLAALAAEHQRLSRRVADKSTSLAVDAATELQKLRTEAEALRKRINERAEQPTPGPRHPNWQANAAFARTKPTGVRSAGMSDVVTDSDSDEYKEQLYRLACASPHSLPADNSRTVKDARNLSRGVRFYAREHEGELPASFEQAADYLDKDEPVPRSAEFELVYQGSLNELKDIPAQAVVLIRERQAWPTPRGQWARVYVMASGQVQVVECDDNFQAWEAEHLVPSL